MKRISLVLCFVLLLVASLAISAFAASSKNIAKDATLVEDGGCGSTAAEYIRDGNVNTAASCGSKADWVNFHFLYEDGVNVSKVVVVTNSTGDVYYGDGVAKNYTELSTLPNIYLRLYTKTDNVYKLENVSASNFIAATDDEGNTLYTTYTFDLEGKVYADVTKVEIATVHGKTNDLGIWEVEIYDYTCIEDTDHNYSEATCTTKATCAYCGATKGDVSTVHTWKDATCAEPKKCTVCGTTEGEADASLHVWKNASYTAPATCKICGATTGDVWVDSTLPNFVRGDEGDKITYEDLVGEIILNSGTTTFGDVTGALDGNYSTWWGGCSGPNNSGGCDLHTESASIKIVFKNEWEITGAKMVAAGNWVSYKIEFFAADGTLLGQYSKGGFQMNTGFCGNQNDATNADREDLYNAVKNISYGDKDKAVKYVIFTNTSSKWHSLPQIAEFEFTGRERIPTACENHQFEERVILDPTCTEPGSKQNVCTICGVAEGLVTIPALDHTYDEYRIKIPATCTTAAVVEFECSRCGITIERPTHINDVTDYADLNGVNTNGAGGWTTSAKALFDNNMDSYLHASGGWFVESALELDMPYYITSVTVWTGSWGDNNSWEAYFTFYYQAPGSDEWVQYETTKAAGVIKAGEKYKHTLELEVPVYADNIKIRVDRLCSYQGQAWEAEVAGSILAETAPLGHTWEVTEVVDAACDAGYTLSTCTVCGETKTDAYTKAIGHIWANATCVAPKTCTVCALTDGDALGHSYQYACDKACQVCGEESNPEATHTLVHVDAVAATCTTNGNVEYWNCSICGYAWLDEACTLVTNQMSVVVPAAHSYQYACDKACQVCGEESNPDATHTLVYVEAVAATCTENGNVEYWYCSICGYAWLDEACTLVTNQMSVIVPAAHTWADATCTAPMTCTVCGEIEGEALGHSYDDGEINWDATCVQDGQMTYTCTICGDAYTEVIPMDTENGHSWWEMGLDAATCQKPGVVYLWCFDCGAESSYEIEANPENHVWVNNEYTAPTCIEDGYVDRTCEECGLNEQKDLPMDEMYHNWEEIENVEATCTTEGYIKTVCTVCKKENVENFGKNEYNHDYEVSYGVLKVCECGDVTLGGTFVGIDNEYEITFDYGNFNIYICVDEEYIVDLYYDYEIISSEDNVYVIELTAQLTDDLGINGQTVVLTLSDEGNTIVVTAADETVYNFENSAEEEQYDFSGLNGTYITADESIMFVVENGFVDLYIDNEFIDTFKLSFDENWNVVVGDSLAIWNIEISAWNYGDYILYEVPEGGEEPEEPVEIPQLSVGENTIEILDGGTIQYVVSVPGDYTLVAGTDTDVYLVKGPYDSEWIEIYPYAFTVREGETVTFAIGRADVQAGTAYVTLTKEGATEPEEPEDVIDNSAINGEYFLPGNFKTFFTFMDGILIIEDENPMMMPSGMAGRYMYTYNVTTGEITLDPANLTMYVENGVIYAVGRMPMPLSVVVPPMELEIGSTVIEVEDQWTGTTVVVSVAGTYILSAPEGTTPYIMVEDASGASAIEQYPYEFTVADGQVFKFIVLEPTTLTLAEKPAHVHTEVEIPAVLPTPSVTGYTAGIMCSDCGETIKAPVAINVTEMADTKDPNFKINSASLTLKENISVNYKSLLTDGYSKPHMVFIFVDPENPEQTKEYVVSNFSIEANTGLYVFNFDGTKPHFMNENIEAYVYAETAEGEYSMNKILTYSIEQYCKNQFNKNNQAQLISDLIVYGAKTQLYLNYKVDSLITDTCGLALTPSTFAPIDASENAQTLTGTKDTGADWYSANLSMGSSTTVNIKFVSDNIEGLRIKINFAGEDKYFDVTEDMFDGSQYVVTIDYIKSYEYNSVITATFERNGKQVGRVLTYSVNSFIYRNYTSTSRPATEVELMKALYLFGYTVRDFFGYNN